MNGWHCFPSWPPTPVFLPRECHGERNLTGYSPWGHKRVRFDLPTEHVRACTHTHTLTHTHTDSHQQHRFGAKSRHCEITKGSHILSVSLSESVGTNCWSEC